MKKLVALLVVLGVVICAGCGKEAPKKKAVGKDMPPPVTGPKAPEAKPAETKPAETKPAEAKPAETKPAEAKPAEKAPPAPEKPK